jgi:riboflavin synthase
MFTGIVKGAGVVRSVRDEGGVLRLSVALPPAAGGEIAIGASISIAGVCLTVVGRDGNDVAFDVVGETLRRTTLGTLSAGARVNVERAARFGDEVGGHLVAGHVRGTAEVVSRVEVGEACDLVLRTDRDTLRYLFEKGFVALDGASLTVGLVDRGAGTFEVHLIPETLRATTFAALRAGDRVNVEVDALTLAVVETVERVLAERQRVVRSS